MTRASELFLTGIAAIAVAALSSAMVGTPSPANAQATVAPAIDDDDIGGVVSRPERPEAGVWVIAETSTPDQICQDSRHRRSGALRHSRPAGGELQRLGARLWSRRFAQDAGKARPASRSDGGACAERCGGGALLSRHLLVFDAENAAGKRVGRQAPYTLIRSFQAGQLAPTNEEHRLHRLPPDRPEATRTIPAQFGTFKSGEEAWMRRVQSGRPGRR